MAIGVFMTSFKCLSDKYSGQIGEDESLDKGHQYFNHVNEYRHQNKEGRCSPTERRIHGTEYKNQTDETHDDNVARNHIRKKTNDEGEGLGENAKNFNRHQDGLHTHGHRRIENMTPEMLVGVEHDNDERYHTQHCGKRDVAGYVCRARYQTNEVIDENEKENSQQVRHISFVVRTQVWLTHFVTHKCDNRFHCILKSAGSRSSALAFARIDEPHRS